MERRRLSGSRPAFTLVELLVVIAIIGDFAPTGKLSFTWPKAVSQLPINVGDSQYDPQFAYGHGLDYENEPATTAATGGN